MEPDNPPPPTSDEVFYARTFTLVTLALLGYFLYYILLPFFAPLAWALFIAFLIYPINAWLVRKLHGRRNLSASLLTFATLLIVIGPVTALSAAFATQVADLLRFAQQFAAEHRPSDISDLANIPLLGPALARVQQAFGVTLAQLQEWAIEGARNVLQFLASMGGKIFLGAVGTVIGFVLMMFLLFFAVRALIPASTTDKNRLFGHLASVTRAMVYGSGVTALTQGALVGIGFAIVGLPSPIVFGVMAALFALVPMAGTPVVWVPAVLIMAAQQRWGAAIFLLAWGIFIVMIDNFLRPYLVAGRAPVGALGVFLGPVVLALVIALIRFALEVRQTTPDSPIVSADEDRAR